MRKCSSLIVALCLASSISLFTTLAAGAQETVIGVVVLDVSNRGPAPFVSRDGSTEKCIDAAGRCDLIAPSEGRLALTISVSSSALIHAILELEVAYSFAGLVPQANSISPMGDFPDDLTQIEALPRGQRGGFAHHSLGSHLRNILAESSSRASGCLSSTREGL